MILLQLYQLHKTSSANKGAVQFFHISKSGGTNLCQSAQSNGCQSEVIGVTNQELTMPLGALLCCLGTAPNFHANPTLGPRTSPNPTHFAAQGFDERSNCLIKEFADTPRWVGHTAHK